MFFQARVKFGMQQIEYIKWYTDDNETISGSKFIVSLVSVVTVRFLKLSD